MEEHFRCSGCGQFKKVSAKVERPGKKPACRSCDESAKNHMKGRKK